MKTKALLLVLLAQMSFAQAQTQWRLEAFVEYFGHVQGSSFGARVKGFIGSHANNPYNVAVASSPSNNKPTGLNFYSIFTPQDTIPLWVIPNGADVQHGDFNGDGYTDFAVWKSVNMGRNNSVLIFLGHAQGIDTVATIELPEEQERSGLGVWMCAGDLNNDGIDDLIVTAPGYSVSQSNNGRVYIYFGRPILKSTSDLAITGDQDGAGLGSRCAVGDFNDDSYNDLAIRGFYQSGQGMSFGYLNIYFGGVQFDTIPELISHDANTAFITDGVTVFDINDDQTVDLLWTFSDSSRRSVFVHYGGKDFQQRFQAGPDFIIHAPAGSSLFGSELCDVGDMNGDGGNDVAIGAYATGQGNGIVFIYAGGKALDDRFDAAIGQSREGAFGWSISRIEDVNNDGYSDIIIGAPTQPWTRYEGYFGIFLGDPRIPNSIEAPNSPSPLGFALYPNYPNPFRQISTFKYSMPHFAFVEIKIYNILGKEVKTLLNTKHAAGQYEVHWNGKAETGEAVPNGIYFVRMKALALGGQEVVFEHTQKFTVVK